MAKKTAAKSIDSVSDLFNFLYEACNILRGPIGQDSFKEYVTPIGNSEGKWPRLSLTKVIHLSEGKWPTSLENETLNRMQAVAVFHPHSLHFVCWWKEEFRWVNYVRKRGVNLVRIVQLGQIASNLKSNNQVVFNRRLTLLGGLLRKHPSNCIL